VVDESLENGLLGHESGERRNAGHGSDADRSHDGQRPGGAIDAGEFADIAGAGLVVDDAHHQEECRFEEPVRQQQRQAGEGGVGGTQPYHHGQEAELADSAVVPAFTMAAACR
jgi:hypothetical protein